ncbi:hypothetical protein [Pseudoflavonifractor phocaeensis]|uniref:hypothetical protein n=1 Tax=Pseudoflavonifractor phocaeensis TaxID=1870988 RepID=UPI001F385513|nr:hypothetical protein [Pseudoflavonifractor phocaeensis]MCF2661452.1 hypothetical protein [Pseudoflavonifractor phocaeensis]
MKKWTRRLWVLLAAFAILLAGWRLGGENPQGRVTARFEADRSALEELALLSLKRGNTENIALPKGWQGISLYGGNTDLKVVEFAFGGSGLGSSTAYWGVNYVPVDRPLGFQGDAWDHWKVRGEGRLYYEPEGDNTCYVQRLAPCWYYYEARF